MMLFSKFEEENVELYLEFVDGSGSLRKGESEIDVMVVEMSLYKSSMTFGC